jgi:hypothetical protein
MGDRWRDSHDAWRLAIMYDWSLHCGKCQATRLAYLYEWRNLIYANRHVSLTGIEL